MLPPVFEIVKELIGIANVISQQSQRAASEPGIDGGDDDEEDMIKALQAAVAAGGQ